MLARRSCTDTDDQTPDYQATHPKKFPAGMRALRKVFFLRALRGLYRS
jgi:hypothetical protein